MITVYLDATTFQCYLSQNEDITRIPYETDFFDGKCEEYILGFRIVPSGYEWTRSDGHVFSGSEMVSAWKPFDELESAQREYERERLADMENALAILLGGETV
jgi:hypothetical protein